MIDMRKKTAFNTLQKAITPLNEKKYFLIPFKSKTIAYNYVQWIGSLDMNVKVGRSSC